MRLAFWNGMKLIVKCIEVFFFSGNCTSGFIGKKTSQVEESYGDGNLTNTTMSTFPLFPVQNRSHFEN